ncbi:AtzE family amidohydrolase [Robbsia sp. Bb-Pol-6]|uniref:AtzE family amidohydrolase n=1 Tax=Robbsia betulipollinis TaxID=2981849 RepID=A0ABT3ZJW4_9BURK|nr:AtzE family amidohydrolase [Robbsia betulipollinis]MCY0386268.1 AtzE family amidohydrolase [Robbsia betulipollinis]
MTASSGATPPVPLSARDLARDVRDRTSRATEGVARTLADIRARDVRYNSFTHVGEQRARAEASRVDARIDQGDPVGPLAGVPIAVKNLFDLTGVTTLAGARLRAEDAPASADAILVKRLVNAGAVVVGALNMDEHAYGFTTENTHFGACRNPHDPARIAGGSSGGSAAAVAAGFVPLTLGSDTNGSIRVPASCCGVFGLKPTFGRLPRTGSFPFVNSLDHLGPFAATVADLALAYDILQGPDAADPACAQRAPEPVSARLSDRPRLARVAILGGYFHSWANEAARAAVQRAADGLGAVETIALPGAEQARAAAFIITAAEGGALHRQRLIKEYDAYEPLSRARLVAGSLVPASWVMQAQRVRQQFRETVRQVFANYDLLLAAATPVAAPRIGTEWLDINGQRVPMRATLGVLTQPISCIGLPVSVVPVWSGIGVDAHLPIGVQLIGAPWREADCLAAAYALEQRGIAEFRLAPS